MPDSRYYKEEYDGPPPENRNFNGGAWFPFVADDGETEPGSLIVRKNLVGFSDSATEEGKTGIAHRFGCMTLKKKTASQAFAQGELVFFKAGAGALRATEAGAYFVGYVHFESLAGNAEVEVILEPGLPPALATANAT